MVITVLKYDTKYPFNCSGNRLITCGQEEYGKMPSNCNDNVSRAITKGFIFATHFNHISSVFCQFSSLSNLVHSPFPQKPRSNVRNALYFSTQVFHLQDQYSRDILTSHETKQRRHFTQLLRVALTLPTVNATPSRCPRTFFIDQCSCLPLGFLLLVVFRQIWCTILQGVASKACHFQHNNLPTCNRSSLLKMND